MAEILERLRPTVLEVRPVDISVGLTKCMKDASVEAARTFEPLPQIARKLLTDADIEGETPDGEPTYTADTIQSCLEDYTDDLKDFAVAEFEVPYALAIAEHNEEQQRRVNRFIGAAAREAKVKLERVQQQLSSMKQGSRPFQGTLLSLLHMVNPFRILPRVEQSAALGRASNLNQLIRRNILRRCGSVGTASARGPPAFALQRLQDSLLG